MSFAHINTARMYGRGLLSGIGQYASTHPEWHFFRSTPSYVKVVDKADEFRRLRDWRPNGAILWDSEWPDDLLSLDIPLIASPNVIPSDSMRERIERLPYIGSDCHAVGRMGADYFLERGYQHYAFCGFGKKTWSRNRQQGFIERVEQQGRPVSVFQPFGDSNAGTWQDEIRQIGQWILDLPKPVALMACNDDRGFDLIEACKQVGCYIPEEVAVLGVDNEEQSCQVCNPPLSSISLNTESAGFQAAQLLDHMMSGAVPHEASRWIAVRPKYVVTRQSTDTLAINDPLVAEAVNFIQTNIYRHIQVSDVARKMVVSRRNLELRFIQAVGRTIYSEIRRIRVNKMIEMLLETQMSITEIAEVFGYADAHNLARFFRKETGMSPAVYRKEHGVR